MWTVPEPVLAEVATVADERQMLEAWLDFHRTTLIHKCAGLDGSQLCIRSAPPSTLSLLGLVRHMTEVERAWFRRGIAGEEIGHLYCAPDGRNDNDFDAAVPSLAEMDFVAFAAELDLARAAAASKALDDTFVRGATGAEVSLRWIYVHMIEEYARHNGHADLLREAIDGATGE